MIVTQRDAKRIIRAAYGPEFRFRLTTACRIGVKPVYDFSPTLAWRKLDKGANSAVQIGKLLPSLDIDWSYAP